MQKNNDIRFSGKPMWHDAGPCELAWRAGWAKDWQRYGTDSLPGILPVDDVS